MKQFAETAQPARPQITDLPFVVDRNKRRSFWHVSPSGDYVKDCDLGNKFALKYLAYEHANKSAMLGWIVRDMPKKHSGVEVGFLTLVALSAGASATHAKQVVAHWNGKSLGGFND